jgi:spermidine synthase
LLLLLSFASGAAALIYEVVWFQLLELFIGSSAVSLAVLLATFMGGTCLGSLLFPRLVPPRRHPLKVYATIEAGIAILGIFVLVLMPLVGRIYIASTGYGLSGFLLRGIAAAACLLLPTMLMGATLPALSRLVQATTAGVSWLGFFYGANIAGAVFGCLFSAFYLLRQYDAAVATVAAAGINLAVTATALVLAAITVEKDRGDVATVVAVAGGGTRQSLPNATVYIAMALSGFCALAGEVIWTRLLGLLLGASVYTLAIILAAFLAGLGIGSNI